MCRIAMINGVFANEEDVERLNRDVEIKIKQRLKMGLKPTMLIKYHCFSSNKYLSLYDVEVIGG